MEGKNSWEEGKTGKRGKTRMVQQDKITLKMVAEEDSESQQKINFGL
jgi:hypothetical protein